MRSKFLGVLLAAFSSLALAQSPTVGLAGQSGSSAVLWPATSGSAVAGFPVGAVPSILSLPMNEGTGLTLHDTSGSNDNATISASGAVTWQSNAGLPGTTPLWTGTGSAVTSSTTLTNFDGTKPFTVTAWIVMPASQVPGEAIIGTLKPASGYAGWEMSLLNISGGDKLQFFLINNYPSTAIALSGTQFLSAGPHCLAIVYNGNAKAAGASLYVDGTLDTNIVSDDTLSGSTASGLPASIAARSDGSNKLTMPSAFIEIWNTALSSATIAANCRSGPAIY